MLYQHIILVQGHHCKNITERRIKRAEPEWGHEEGEYKEKRGEKQTHYRRPEFQGFILSFDYVFVLSTTLSRLNSIEGIWCDALMTF